MMNNSFNDILDSYMELINGRLDEYKNYYMSKADKGQGVIAEAMWYSLSAGGKRIRPVLVLEFCRMCGGDISSALSSACAVEMIHTFSLIHDDMPCMDDDDYRRGQPSCHKRFGEAMALLAGDALLNHAYEIICNDGSLTAETKIKIIARLSHATGINGMTGGQVLDIEQDSSEFSLDKLTEMYKLKTGALLAVSCVTGCLVGGGSEKQIKAASEYAEKMGLAFQIIDDILDIEGTDTELGKPVGSDERHNKKTYASAAGTEKAAQKARQLTNEALAMLSEFDNSNFIKELTRRLLSRKK
jgi:geranylgeranyl diphosphate synthase type II